jgi:hypothetical protein
VYPLTLLRCFAKEKGCFISSLFLLLAIPASYRPPPYHVKTKQPTNQLALTPA